MTDESSGAPDAAIGRWSTRGWTTAASGPADLIDALDTRLSEADARRLGRVLRSLADAGLIDECYVVVCAVELGGPGA